ncbi:MAG: hypothetical protein JST16_00740 [Bdellovibrionales bacterium]|nr:hypothetical protein [Bdellovibrionales bacterium]
MLFSLLLTGCFEHPLPSTHFGQSMPPAPTPITTADRAAEDTSHATIDRIVSSAFGEARHSADDVLGDLLTSETNGIQPFRIEFKDIRYMQEKYLQMLKARKQSATDGGASPSEEDKPLPVFRFVRSQCKARPDDIQILRNEIRYIKDIYRKNVDPCDYDFSLNFELMLNALLKNKEVRVDLGGERRLRNMDDFIRWLGDKGFESSAEFRTYLASFFRFNRKEGDIEDPSSEIPLPLWLDLGLKTPEGRAVQIPAAHSEVYFRFRHTELGTLHVKIHFSSSGFDFEADGSDPAHWTGMRVLERYEPSQVPQLLRSAKRVADTYVSYMSLFPANPPMSGFGLLGVCTDGAALMIRDAGSSTVLPFPMIRTDLVKMPDDFPIKRVWNALIPDSAESELSRDPAERLQRLRERILVSNPFTEETPSPLTDYNDLIRELQKMGTP